MRKKPRFLFLALLAASLITFAMPVQAASVTRDVYGNPEVASLPVKTVPGDKQLTVQFPVKFSESTEAVSFILEIRKSEEKLPFRDVTVLAGVVSSDTASYTFKELANDTGYTIDVTGYSKDAEIIAHGRATGTPIVKPIEKPVVKPAAKPVVKGVAAKAGNAKIAVSFNKLAGATSYQIQYWTKKDAAGNPVYEKPITIPAASVKSATFTYTFSKLKNGTVYHFNVVALKKTEVIALTSNVTATPKAPSAKKK
ncbi:fibronectin type III domain-containing protein [Cohnella suwonensis]|uniref:Fibronectin type III domain-containing protein n=1 Tax=Cohnella suwonensis TaxID=696072 RepID=A0ABW0LSM1_9BACL